MTTMLAVVSYNRPSFFRQCLDAIQEHCAPVLDGVFAYVDGFSSNSQRNQRYEQLVKRYRTQGIDASIGRRNRGVGPAKNVLLRKMLNAGAEVCILCEDDMLVQSPEAVTGYLAAMESSGLHHLAFAHHGPGNREPVAIGKGVELFPDYVGAYSVYTRESLEACGLFDENFKGALEHVELSVRMGEMGYTSPWKCAADATDSDLWIQEIPGSIENSTSPVGSIKTQRAWAQGVAYWRQKDPALAARVFDERGNVRQNVPLPQGMQTMRTGLVPFEEASKRPAVPLNRIPLSKAKCERMPVDLTKIDA
jgi:hypothetical protein